MAKYNDMFADYVSHEIYIKKIDKMNEEDVLNKVFDVDKNSEYKHNSELIKLNNQENLLYYIISNWSMYQILYQLNPDIKSDLANMKKILKKNQEESKGWFYGEITDDMIVKNPIADFFIKNFNETFNEKPINTYLIDSYTNYYYACYWEDYLLEFKNFYIHIHFALDD